MSLQRRHAMAALLANRADDLLVVPGLGSTTWDLAAVGDDPRNFYSWGAMGGAAMIGLGLALAQPTSPPVVPPAILVASFRFNSRTFFALSP